MARRCSPRSAPRAFVDVNRGRRRARPGADPRCEPRRRTTRACLVRARGDSPGGGRRARDLSRQDQPWPRRGRGCEDHWHPYHAQAAGPDRRSSRAVRPGGAGRLPLDAARGDREPVPAPARETRDRGRRPVRRGGRRPRSSSGSRRRSGPRASRSRATRPSPAPIPRSTTAGRRAASHVVQIEIDRSLYMDEARVRPRADFQAVQQIVGRSRRRHCRDRPAGRGSAASCRIARPGPRRRGRAATPRACGPAPSRPRRNRRSGAAWPRSLARRGAVRSPRGPARAPRRAASAPGCRVRSCARCRRSPRRRARSRRNSCRCCRWRRARAARAPRLTSWLKRRTQALCAAIAASISLTKSFSFIVASFGRVQRPDARVRDRAILPRCRHPARLALALSPAMRRSRPHPARHREVRGPNVTPRRKGSVKPRAISADRPALQDRAGAEPGADRVGRAFGGAALGGLRVEQIVRQVGARRCRSRSDRPTPISRNGPSPCDGVEQRARGAVDPVGRLGRVVRARPAGSAMRKSARFSFTVTTRPAMSRALARSATFSDSRQRWPSSRSGSAVSSKKVVSFEIDFTG